MSKKGYTTSGDEEVEGDRQSMYDKDIHFEGNMNHRGHKGYEPTHTIHKGHGGIEGAGVSGHHKK